LTAETAEDTTTSYSEPPLPKERNPEQSHTSKDSGTNYYMTNSQANSTWENPEKTFTITMETVTPHQNRKTKPTIQALIQRQNPLQTKENDERSQAQKMKQINKSVTHQFLSNHYVKFPHYEEPAQSPMHFLTKGLTSPYYHHQQLNTLASLHLRRNNLCLYPLTWQQQRYN